jgi:ABC-type antimicrobial peptide transport system permease subunit
MLLNYLKIALRNLIKNKVYSFINIGGLAVGMAVAMLIGLWIWDEVGFDKHHKNYERIGQLWQFVKFDAEKSAYNSLPIPLAAELRNNYPDFKRVSLSTYTRDAVLAAGDKKFTKSGNYVEPDFLKMISLKMLSGNANSLEDIHSVLLSESLAQTLFDTADPLNKVIKMDNKMTVNVAGVYQDFPNNSSFKDVSFLAPWQLFLANDNAKNAVNEWDENSFLIYVELKELAFDKVSAKIKDIRMKRENPPPYKPEFFVHPMSKWHLYGDFKDGVNTGGYIQFVWLFGIIGLFVLLLACINFMNLTTARSDKRAKEVGIRKAIGSVRNQLIGQFLSESLLVVAFAFGLSLLLVQLFLPFFNAIADKKIYILWSNPLFWLLGTGFSLLTGFIAGSYPAFYLSSFQPVKVLKGTFRAGRLAALPRKVLVVFQFSVSIILIIGTIIVFRQLEFARNRPVGFSRNGLIEFNMNPAQLSSHYNTLRNDLLATGAVFEMSGSTGSVITDYGGTTDITWKGRNPDTRPLFLANQITHDFGKTVGWQLVAGRDFSRKFSTDSAALILNETAVKTMGFKDPLAELVRLHGTNYKVIGIVKDIMEGDPFQPVKASFFVLGYNAVTTVNIKLAPQLPAREALASVEKVFAKYNPEAPFDYKFVDDEYAKKFMFESRIGKLATFFAILAIFISCLGLFGLASFVAEQRIKEIAIRKVLGATIAHLWQLLSKEFMLLVILSCLIATPIAYYVMNQWLQNYDYRTEISWWIFAAAGLVALLITLLTVSFQAIKAALANPVKSLRNE